MFKNGMIVEALRDTKFCKKGEIAEVDTYTQDGEKELYFFSDDSSVPEVYFNFEDFKVIQEDARIAVEYEVK